MMTLETLNTLSAEAFTEILGAIFEHSPWVPQRAAAARPFTSRLQLLDAMRAVVQSAPVEQQLALIRAHPQLGARGRKRLELTEASSREQRRAGLDACTDEEFAELMRLNAAYVQKFSFPFILAVRGHGPESILKSMQSRLDNDMAREHHTALTQIGLIGGYRLADVVASPPAAEATAMAERLAAATSTVANPTTASATAANPTAAAALLREWMLAANFDVHGDPGLTDEFLGVHAQLPSPPPQASVRPSPQPANPQVHGSAPIPPQPVTPQIHGSAPAAPHPANPYLQGPDRPASQRQDHALPDRPPQAQQLPSLQHLLVGIYSDPTTNALHRDGRLAPVLGIALAQHLRQQRTPTRLGLLVLASPTSSQSGSVLLDPNSPPVLGPIESNSLAHLRAAGITDQCLTVVRAHGAALPESNATAIDRALRTLEHLLT